MLNYSIESCSIYLWIKFKYLSHIDTQRLSECTWNASDFVLEYCTDWFPPSTASVCACPYLWNVMPSRINYWGHVTDSRSERSQLTREVQPVLAYAIVLTCKVPVQCPESFKSGYSVQGPAWYIRSVAMYYLLLVSDPSFNTAFSPHTWLYARQTESIQRETNY